MKIHSISNSFFKLCSFDNELVYNKNRRPHVVVKNLVYKEKRQHFAIPLRSNINAPNYQYFSLPPTSKTKKNRAHGIHYIKMFPIKSKYLEIYYNKSKAHLRVCKIIQKKSKTIVQESQQYLNKYEKGNIHKYATNIEKIYKKLHNIG